ncbi:MAG: hypothetical protein JWP11_784 [Frankiales bacterium]|nr:hypothetical protein [Frankiales bacterium]
MGLALCGLATAGLETTATGVGLAATTVSPQTSIVSVADPFAPLDCGQPVGVLRAHNSPREPVVAVNPADPGNVVVTYIVDGDLTNLIRASHDGGATWQTVTVPGISVCSGGANAAAADPSLAFSADGRTLYLTSLTTPTLAPVGTDTVIVSTSHDGGFTWSAQPTTLSSVDGMFGDKNIVTTDPVRPATAYVTFERHDSFEYSSSTLFFRRTDDGGVTWSPATVVYTPPGPGFSSGNAQVLRAANGTLVDVFDRIIACQLNTCADYRVVEDNVVYAAVSTDDGQHWAAPVKIGNRTAGPGTNDGAFCGDLWASIQATSAPDGTLYVAYPVDAHTADLPVATDLVVRKSADGIAWTSAGSLTAPTVIGLPAIAVAADGTVAMTYYQREQTACSAPEAVDPTDVWFARSRDGGRTWVTSELAGPFDAHGNCFLPGTPGTVEGAPKEGCLVADYDGLQAAGPNAFVGVFEQPGTRGQYRSDIVFARVPASPRHLSR